MAVTILHGHNHIASREKYISLKQEFAKKGFRIVTLEGKKTNFDQISLESQATSLLLEKTAVCVENFLSNSKKLPKSFPDISGIVVLWESDELPRALLNTLPKNWTVSSFPLPKYAFTFLDALSPGSFLNALRILHQMSESDTQFILPLISWHIRFLLWAKVDPESLEEPEWKKRKLLRQANEFTQEQLYELHHKILLLDRAQKTGTLTLPLIASLDVLLSDL